MRNRCYQIRKIEQEVKEFEAIIVLVTFDLKERFLAEMLILYYHI